ncbi:MAG: response regulator transcription factor [Promethearchaeota archaeon]
MPTEGVDIVTIFTVDDDENLHQIYRTIFSIRGHSVVAEAYNGAEAIEVYSTLNPKPDIILMDYRMPVMDGIMATKELKKKDPSCHIIFVSADESAKEAALAAGASEFKIKPVRINELEESITKIINSSK